MSQLQSRIDEIREEKRNIFEACRKEGMPLSARLELRPKEEWNIARGDVLLSAVEHGYPHRGREVIENLTSHGYAPEPTLTISGDLEEAKKQLREILGKDDAEKRIKFNQQTNEITVDFSGIDFERNEGAKLLNDVISSRKVFDVSIGPTVETRGGQLSLTPTAKGGSSLVNLDNNPDNRLKNGKRDIDKPRDGVDDQIGINFSFRRENSKSTTDLPQAKEYTVTFHELAEAYSKVTKNKQYAQAHQEAIDRETTLRDQRPDLKKYNPGSGPGTTIIVR